MEATLPEALDNLLSVLAGGSLTVVVACLLGRTALAALRHFRGKLTATEGWILSFAVGSALLSTLVFALCSAGWFADGSVLVVATVTIASWLRWGRWKWPAATIGHGRFTRPHLLLISLPCAIYGVLYLVHTLAPETRTDAMGYHLGLVQRYYRENGFVPVTTNIYAHISQGAEMLYLFAYAIGRESAAKVVHFSFLVGTVGAILCLARRFRADLAGIFAAVVFFTCPVVIPDATSAYNDCALAFSLLMVFYVLALWWQDPRLEWLGLMGLLIGFSFAIKYTGVVAVAAAIVSAARTHWPERNWHRTLQGFALTGLAAAAIGLPWLAKNAIFTGNPLAPFFNGWFRNPHFSIEWESAYRFAMSSYRQGPFDRWEQILAAPFDLVMGERYGGSIGWILLLAPIALLALRRPFGRAVFAASLVCGLPWLANAGARFLIPSVIFGAIALGLVLEALPGRIRMPVVASLLTAQCLTSWPAQRAQWYYPNLWTVEGFPWKAALRLEPQKWHLARNVEFFLIADQLDKITSSRTRILSFFNLPEAYFRGELLVSFQGLENQDLADTLLASVNPGGLPDHVLRASWASRPLRGVRILQHRPERARAWAVSELHFLRNGEEISPPDGLAASAFPLPWHAPRLVDGRIFPLWNSREPPSPRMSIEARFRSDIPLDGLEMLFPRTYAGAHSTLAISGLDSDGEWREIAPLTVDLLRRPIASSEGREAASAMLRRHRIEFVVLNLSPNDPYYPQSRIIASNPGAWDLKRVFVDRTAVLFELLPGAP